MEDKLLAIDIGNSNITLGLFQEKSMQTHWHLRTDIDKTSDEYAVLLSNLFAQREKTLRGINGCVISCVVPPLVTTFQELGKSFLGLDPLFVSSEIETGMQILTDDPREVGPDRVVNALAAKHLYGKPAIVIEFSTATAFDAVSAGGDYLGVALAPGLTIAAEALFRQTAQLRRIELTAPPRAIGTNTVHSMQAGVVFGYVGLVEGMVTRFQDELGGNAHVIATGEQSRVITKLTDVIEVVDLDLTLAGLRLIYEMNDQT